MTIDARETQRVAKLAAIAVDAEQAEHLAGDLTHILELIEQVQGLDTSQVQPLSHPLEIAQAMRPDVVSETDQHQQFQSLASKVEADLYLVPKVIGS